MDFPEIPREVVQPFKPLFVPSPELRDWVRDTFIEIDSKLWNPDHTHLRLAHLGFLWTNVGNAKNGRCIIGTAQEGQPNGQAWSKGQKEQQITEWFGIVPDFIITLSATWAAGADMMSICALIEHELYHCGQKLDAFGFPEFYKDGLPKYAMRAHDVEEFVGVVDRYGVGNQQHEAVRSLVDAAKRKPSVGRAKVDGACGCCLRKVV